MVWIYVWSISVKYGDDFNRKKKTNIENEIEFYDSNNPFQI